MEATGLFEEPPKERATMHCVKRCGNSCVDLCGFKEGGLTLLPGIPFIGHSILRG